MASPRSLVLGAILGSIPVFLIVGLLWKPWTSPIPCTLKPLEFWRDGTTVKTTSCDWYEDDSAWGHFCTDKPDGTRVGCWTERNGAPWDGDRVEWYWYSKEPNAKEAYGVVRVLEHYEGGLRAGTWKVYYQTGVLMNEITFEDGKRTGFQSYGPDGKPIRRAKGKIKEVKP